MQGIVLLKVAMRVQAGMAAVDIDRQRTGSATCIVAEVPRASCIVPPCFLCEVAYAKPRMQLHRTLLYARCFPGYRFVEFPG